MTSPTGWERPDVGEPDQAADEPTLVASADEASATEESTVVEPTVVESTVVEPEDVEPTVIEPEVVEPVEVLDEATEPDAADTVDAEVVEQPADEEQPEEPVTTLALGDAEPEAPAATDFDVAAEAPSTPPAPAPSQPGGSWLDLPPMPDIPGLPPMAPQTPPSQGFGQAPAPEPQQYTQPSFGVGYDQQRAGQAYGHGATAPTATQTPGYQPQPQYPPVTGQAPYAPYGTPAGAGYGQLQPYTAGYNQGTDTQLASMAHWLPLVVSMFTGGLGFVAPLIIMLTRGKTDPFVRAHAVEALNFQLTLIIALLASAVLSVIVIGIAGFVVFPILALIFQIRGAIAASRGELYSYPVRIPFVK